MDSQEIFDKVVDHLRKQGHRSVDEYGSCMYRAPNGDMCAVGCLIPDNLYRPVIEGIEAGPEGLMGDILRTIGITDYNLVKSLQVLHDCNLEFTGENFESKVSRIADNFGLRYSHE